MGCQVPRWSGRDFAHINDAPSRAFGGADTSLRSRVKTVPRGFFRLAPNNLAEVRERLTRSPSTRGLIGDWHQLRWGRGSVNPLPDEKMHRIWDEFILLRPPRGPLPSGSSARVTSQTNRRLSNGEMSGFFKRTPESVSDDCAAATRLGRAV